jgi:hypothetical protein
MLIDELQEPRWHENAMKLIYPLLQDFKEMKSIPPDRLMSNRGLKFCCRVLGEDSEILGDEQVRSKSVAILVRLAFYTGTSRASEPLSDTQAQFDQLVDYLLHICEGTDDEVIKDAFQLLAWLGGSPSTLDRMRRYIDMIIRFMDYPITRLAVLRAAYAVRSAVASMGRDDESLREQFSKALTSALLWGAPQTSINDTLFTDVSSIIPLRDIPYLTLLCALSQEPTWHFQLHHNDHFNNCLAIAKVLSSQEHNLYVFNNYAVPVAQIFAIIVPSWDEHTLFTEDHAYLIWPLLLRAWHYIFGLRFFGGIATVRWWKMSTTECIDALPSLVEYARKQRDQSEETDRLLALVEKAYRKLDEDKPQREQDGPQRIQDDPFWQQILPVLRKQISELLDASRGNV